MSGWFVCQQTAASWYCAAVARNASHGNPVKKTIQNKLTRKDYCIQFNHDGHVNNSSIVNRKQNAPPKQLK